ncbi:hypothetical protein BH23BAC2_BH23BAC2_13250 [soil metagenome]
MTKKTLHIVILAAILALWPIIVSAQDTMPEPQMSSSPNPPPPGLVVPIDGGISLLAVLGLLMGVYFFKPRK